jgi:ribulose-5-phosphate 4-epimerase/fuculose-1-phosphate aldolase
MTPVFDARQHFREGDIKDHLIRSEHLGAALASHFTDSSSGSSLDRSVVLMRGHGMTVAASTIEHCVFRAIYAQNNAQVQTTALLLSSSLSVGARAGDGRNDVELAITYLDNEEIADSININTKTALRPWRSWAREAEASPLYVNLA